jgi:hypothetical protein
MGFSCILNRPHVDCVVLLVASQPFDEDRGPLVIHGNNQSIGISLDIEDHPIRANNAGMGVSGLDVGGTLPLCLPSLLKPASSAVFSARWSLLPSNLLRNLVNVLRAMTRTQTLYHVPNMGTQWGTQSLRRSDLGHPLYAPDF